MTEQDRKHLRSLNALTRSLNEYVEMVSEGKYEVELRTEVAKRGHPQLRFELRRKVG